mgnify:CR=1 FL=1
MINNIKKFSEFLKRYLPLFIFIDILLALSVGFVFPAFATSIKFIIPYAMFVMLFPMMMGIAIRELKMVAKDKKILLISILINFLLSPIIAYIWAKLFFDGLDPLFIVGWILKLTVPCSAMMVAWTGLSKGKTETALVIQVVSFLFAIVAIPFWMIFLLGKDIDINFLFISQKILWIIVLPMIAGIATREWFIRKKYGKEIFNREIKPFLPPISSIGMYIVIFIAVSGEVSAILKNLNLIWILTVSVLIVYPILFFIAIWVSKKLKVSYENAIAIGFSSTAKNHGITLAIALSAFGGLSILPASIVPMLQVILMLGIWKASPRIKRWFGE